MNMWNSAIDVIVRMSGLGAVAIAIILLILAAGGRWLTPQWRYGLWLLVMVRLLLPVVPESSVSIYHLLRTIGHTDKSSISQDKTFVGMLPVPGVKVEPMDTPLLVMDGSSGVVQITVPQIVLLAWLFGVILMLLGLMRGMLTVRRMKESSQGDISPALLELVQSCREQAGISEKIAVHISEHISSPVLVGAWEPVVLLPVSMAQKWETGAYTAPEMRHILLHEFMHYKRGDIWAAGLAAAVRCVYWFHPLVWLAVAQLRREQEMACDADVLRVSNGERDKVEYGRTLIKLADEGMSDRLAAGALGIVEKKSQLRRRIEMISRYRNSGWGQTLAGGAIVAAVVATTFTEARAEETVPANLTVTQSNPQNESLKSKSENLIHSSDLLITSSSDLKTTEPDFSKPGVFRIMVAPDIGELIYTFDEQTKALETITAKNDVSYETADFKITSDNMNVKTGAMPTTASAVEKMGLARDYTLTADNGEVMLKGKGFEGMRLTADKVTYLGETKEFILDGNANAWQKDKTGRLTTTRAEKATIRFLSEGKWQIRMVTETAVKPAEEQKAN